MAGETTIGRRRIGAENRPQLRKEASNTVFTAGKRREFLAELAVSCNVSASARAIGVVESTIYKRRLRDPVFRREWAVALAEGYARLEMFLLERAIRDAGGGEDVEMEAEVRETGGGEAEAGAKGAGAGDSGEKGGAPSGVSGKAGSGVSGKAEKPAGRPGARGQADHRLALALLSLHAKAVAVERARAAAEARDGEDGVWDDPVGALIEKLDAMSERMRAEE